jgi:uncharacterized protein (TIGR02594 family)
MATMQPNDPLYLQLAFRDLGTKEIAGPNANPKIVRMFAKAGSPGVKSDEVPWCSAAMCAWVLDAGLVPTYSLAARSWLTWGRPLDINAPLPRGAIVIFRRGNHAWQGHVAILLEDRGTQLTVIGANQQNAVTIANYSRAALIGARLPHLTKAAELAEDPKAQLIASATTGTTGFGVEQSAGEYLQSAQGIVMQLALTGFKWVGTALMVLAVLIALFSAGQLLHRIYRHYRPAKAKGPTIDGKIIGGRVIEESGDAG